VTAPGEAGGGGAGGAAGGGGAGGGGAGGAADPQDALAEFRFPVVALVLTTGVAGMADAFTLLRYGVFVANQSGNLVHSGMAIGGKFPDWPAALASIAGFGLGGTLATLVRRRGRVGRWAPPAGELVTAILTAVVWALVDVAVATAHPGPGQRALLAAVGAVTLGILAVLFVRTAGIRTTTTYQTGTVLSTAQAFADLVQRAVRHTTAVRRWSLGLLGITCYALGGTVGSLIVGRPGLVFALGIGVLVALLLLIRPPRFGRVRSGQVKTGRGSGSGRDTR
jgi:uncharacterized membrane protein YoaK (UPF0700 family)